MHIFTTAYSYDTQYKNLLYEPLNAVNEECHTQICTRILCSKLQHIKPANIYDKIKYLHYLHMTGAKEFDEKTWFIIGQLEDAYNNLYFAYDVHCSGTGFGLGETSKMFFAKTPELLVKYGLTFTQRELIWNHNVTNELNK